MIKDVKKRLFLFFYFFIFWLLPTIVLGGGLFIKDIGWYLSYVVKIFPILSFIFFVVYFKIYGFKKNTLIPVVLLILVSAISFLVIFFRIANDFSDFNPSV